MRRSASSVISRPTPEPDVSEHFRRSLSGSLLHRKNSQTIGLRQTPTCSASPLQKIIVNNSGVEIEDHFRKALGEEAYEQLRRSRQAF
ncbi:unnamed protein product [Gongylonema pulchrum]|uniref:Uncharacterized protein n=1 Tax=Gongylonema pulchrum TaxID=637853 RepID=A0A183DN70_9BILA|nr:unnamed protein product [Gongylonema pulchrum]